MTETPAHPASRAFLECWRALGSQGPAAAAARAAPAPVERLFVLQRAEREAWCFRLAGPMLQAAFGRDLREHDAAALFRIEDRALARSFLDHAAKGEGAACLTAIGETLGRRALDIEVVLLSLAAGRSGAQRLLGLFQPLDAISTLAGRPIARLSVCGLHPAAPAPLGGHLALVSSR
jgi:hypothetical protein